MHLWSLSEGSEVTEADLIEHARGQLAGFKRPKRVVFEELPKTDREDQKESAQGACCRLDVAELWRGNHASDVVELAVICFLGS